MPPGVPSAMSMKRINREILDLQKEDKGEITLAPLEDNVYVWKGTIPGPEGSVYEGGVFDVDIALPNDYPFSAPKVLFKTRIYHMNISEQGNICIDILKNQWSPALSLFKVMLSLSSLLTDPNPRDPLVPSIAQQYSKSRKTHDLTARQWTALYARPKMATVPTPPAPAPKAAAPAPAAPSSRALPPTSPPRTRGKRRAADPPMPTAGPSSSSSAGRSSATVVDPEVIVLDSDGEEEEARRARGQKRKRVASNLMSSNTGRGEVLDLAGSDDEDSREEEAARERRSARGSGGRRSGGAGVSDEIIVIED